MTSFLSGQILTADDLNDAFASVETLKARKTGNETVNNSTTYQDDNHLLLTPSINTTYTGHLHLIYSATNTIDFKGRFTYPSGATVSAGWLAPESGTNQSDFEGDVRFGSILAMASPLSDMVFGTHNTGGGTAAPVTAEIWFDLAMGSTAGQLVFQWAQNAAVATDLILYAGSYIEMKREA
jgi:hypothetical protein